jgi:hypothetical protein
MEASIAIARLAPERIVVLPQDANPAFRNAISATCHGQGLTPMFIEVAEPRVEHALLAVAAGAGPAILPASVADRYAAPGVRLVPLADAGASLRTVALTVPDRGTLATAAFLRALDRAARARPAASSSPAVVALSA